MVFWITYHRKAKSGHFIEEMAVIKLFRRNYARDLYGLPRFLGIVGHGIQPIKYRMLKSKDSFILSRANLWGSVSQNNIPKVSFSLL